ncbi:phosphate ABC transporter substrate-binding protein PstS [uncultured Microbacterium sp.]|uniref:phosphate ABC transporter substrate-binding protein PstS n=1 Tax=uncultured Microbacterium sp. TaxID=191216 RepID=UPI0025F8A736|nr:phosphate ABC transporter substrate-binding protein PstS [uncultured Microbacterium sp.]
MNVPLRLVRLVAMLAAAALVALMPVPAQAADGYPPISGSGSTWSQNALDQWRKNVASNMTVNFSGTGSSAGRTDFINQTVDFAVSEIPFQDKPEDGSPPEKPPVSFSYMPIVAGGTSLMYNLKIGGKRVTNLRLSGEVIAKIFTGQISKWNDAAIAKENPALSMPDRPITPVYRSDGSGTSAQFTKWMSDQYPSIWTQGMRSQFPAANATFKGQSGSLGVAGYVSQNYGEGAITYVEYSYAMKSGFPVVKVLNKAGYYVEPTYQSVAVALMSATINPDLTQNLGGVYNSTDPRSYPMSSYSYMIVPTQPTKVFTAEKGKTLSAFGSYMLCVGQQQASSLGYSPLPMNLVAEGFRVLASLPGTTVSADGWNQCDNPNADNKLAASAPQPAECDKQGDKQCTSGTGGAQQDTPATGAGGGGSATKGGSTAGASTESGAVAPAVAAEAAVTDTGDTEGLAAAGANAAVSSPFTLPEDGWGTPQSIMLAAGLLLIAAILVPPLVMRRPRSDPRQK